MVRVPSCIPGLDRLLEGGFPAGASILLSGPPGTGKTLFGLQFLYEGLIKHNEPGLFVQTQEFDQTIYMYGAMLGWNIRSLQEKQKLAIFSLKPKDYSKFEPARVHSEVLSKLKTLIVGFGVKRMVIDSVTPLAAAINDVGAYSRSLYETIEFAKEDGITSVLISKEDSKTEEHLCDGVIKLRAVETDVGEYKKELMVTKMVATSFPMAWYPVTISSKLGFSVRPFL